eukprot:2032244-Karenia_brevis.AAC.1
MLDFIIEEVSSDDENKMFFQITAEAQKPQPSIPDSPTKVYNIVGMLNYGRNRSVDILELCGGEGRISQAWSRR